MNGKTEIKTRRVVPVLVPMPAERPYSYLVPEEMDVQAGSIVRVPLGPREVAGIVTDDASDQVDPKKLKSILHVFDCPPVSRDMLRFIRWTADYTLSPPGMVAKMVLRAPAAFDPEPFIPGLRYIGGKAERLTAAREKVLEVANNGLSWTKSGLAHAAGVSGSVVEGLKAQGLFEEVMIPPPPVVGEPDPFYGQAELSEGQQAAAQCLVEAVEEQAYSVSLLHGVTGSGKTEVYFEAVARAVELGKQVLILLPEIALTQQFLDRFESRFGTRPAEWHSDLAPRQRERVWRQIAEGTVKVVAGARSALFLPFANPGLIIVDEEHDPAYKQEDRVFYNARDMAVVRGSIGKFPVILASATPSIESLVNANQGRYRYVPLQGRYADAALPDLKPVDMRRSPPVAGRFLSPALTEAVGQVLQRKEQALLFLNRRGYAPLTLCRVCGHRFQCPDCSSWLVEHRFRGQLMCHQCGYHEKSPEACPSCGALDHLVACGPGVERIAEETAATFPDARIIVLSSDMLGGVTRLRMEMEAIAKGEADIVIGTQLVAKGHNFPLITLVGVIDADLGLANGDPRAAERTFQLLNQVTGRAGRTGRKSVGLIQTYQPDHPVLKAIIAGDAHAFYEREIEERQRGMLPPFGRLAALIISADSRAEAESHARALRRAAPRDSEIEVLGPAEAPLAVIRGRHRFRLLVQGSKRSDLQSYLRALLQAAPKARGSLRVQVDIDPQSFL
ncbi:primosomal protein N' (replication factor Y) [Pseudochrobactrum saccharolyticum]|uniref:Replication restart protein PriA n=2 Tax=Pseudochrobactrum saccharolyticum TaxID=354352 RepID=A0A7W8AMI9_9HYPH|nr:primosomal protein N' [Pseudochrobactrum saccharolyticum]MBB5092544.1 primosomal protein N' (replication factor Y) [Pseudochrobactrum saccharolyticum]